MWNLIDPPANNDSVELMHLLKGIYQWHAKDQGSLIDFALIVKDSFQTGINYDAFNKTFRALKQTNYFSISFMENKKK